MRCCHWSVPAIVFAALLGAPGQAIASAPPKGNVIAGASGQDVSFPGGAVVHLAPGSHAQFTGAIPIKLGTAGQPSTRTWTLKLASGRADVDVPAADPPTTAVLVRLPCNVSAIAKSGAATLRADKGHAVAAAVGGAMLVAVGDDWKPLPAGLARSFGEGQTGAPHAILGAPAVSAPAAPLVAMPEASAPIRWKAVDGATHYVVSITGAETRRLGTEDDHVSLEGLRAGTYQVAVQAVDSSGIEGRRSAPVAVHVVGVELPPGAYTSGGVIELGQSDEATFTGIDGLEASYGHARVFVPAPRRIGVHDGEPLVVRFRAQGARAETSVRLEPRGVRAAIEIGPHDAHWPSDRVTVKVHLFDKNGRSVPERVQAVPKVMIDVDPVDVDWKHVGADLVAVVPPPVRSGPWVVRVEVADQYGEELGRDFLEVVSR